MPIFLNGVSITSLKELISTHRNAPISLFWTLPNDSGYTNTVASKSPRRMKRLSCMQNYGCYLSLIVLCYRVGRLIYLTERYFKNTDSATTHYIQTEAKYQNN